MASSPEEDRAHYLIKKLAGYILLYQQCSDKLRPHGRTKMDPVYDEAYKAGKATRKIPLLNRRYKIRQSAMNILQLAIKYVPWSLRLHMST